MSTKPNGSNAPNGSNGSKVGGKTRKKLGEKDEKDKRPEIHVSRHRIGDTIYEEVNFMHTAPMFLIKSKDSPNFRLDDRIETDDAIYVPELQPNLPFTLPLLDKETWLQLAEGKLIVKVQEVYDLIYDKYDVFLDLEGKYKVILTGGSMESYQQHKNNTVGYIFITGMPGSGKSRVLDVASRVCYHPMYCAEANAANVYRFLGFDKENEAQQTIIEDELNFSKKMDDEESAKYKIYRAGYRRGITVPRIENAGSSEAVQRFYRAFDFKMFAGYTMHPKDKAFNRRNTETPIVEGDPMRDELTLEDEPIFDEVRIKALIWRMQTYFDKNPDIDLPQLKGCTKEIWKPRILAVMGTDAEEVMKNLALENIKEKFEEKHEQLERYVVQVVLDLGCEFDWFPIPFPLIWNFLMKDFGTSAEASVEDCQSVDVQQLSQAVSKNAVGRILNSSLHGKYKVGKIGKDADDKACRVWKFEQSHIERLAKSYQLSRREL